jgi:hypothetical protein
MKMFIRFLPEYVPTRTNARWCTSSRSRECLDSTPPRAICPVCGAPHVHDAARLRIRCDRGDLQADDGAVHRNVVTVLFCDVVGSTALGEASDPETLQAVFARNFERMRTIVETHGGTVEKFIGDAVMAMFGS